MKQQVLVATAGLWTVIGCLLLNGGTPGAQGQPVQPDSRFLKTETFDRDPGWVGVNHRSARDRDPVTVRQDFGFSPSTQHAGGAAPGEIGGWITPAGEAAWYAREIEPVHLDQRLTASGRLCIEAGATNLLLGFFNSATTNEWRTPQTLALRLNGRGDRFFAYVEYCTVAWRAGGDTTPFPTVVDPSSGRATLVGFPCGTPLNWALEYDPQGNSGRGVLTATLDGQTAVCLLDEGHLRDGAEFNRFGVLNVMKSADRGSAVWFDDLRINRGPVEGFDRDPGWDGHRNRETRGTRLVRPWFDFGFSETHFAGGQQPGELGGQIFRGDCRYPDKMACYGDRVGPLRLDRGLHAHGTLAMTRGVSDSTALFGFYHSRDSLRSHDSQAESLPESVLGIQIEGPSSEGFRFYPVVRARRGNGHVPAVRQFPAIVPDGRPRTWSLDYQPAFGGRQASLKVTLGQESRTWNLDLDPEFAETEFDRFGVVTTWIDGNGQQVYWDDISYTVRQE